MTKTGVEIKGMAELRRNLKELGGKTSKNAIRAGLRAGGRDIVKQARTNLPGNYNTLRKSLTVIANKQKGNELSVSIGPTIGINAKYDGWYAHIVERGAAPHDISVSRKKALANTDVVFGKSVAHPGIPARPFLLPALEGRERKVMNSMKIKVWEVIKMAHRKRIE